MSQIQFYLNNYDIKYYEVETKNLSNSDKKFVGNKDNRFCRFCKRGTSDTSFRKVAHAIPELIGNKNLISYEECDECNKLFSHFENELAHYINFERPATGIKGKKGYTTYKNNKGLKVEHQSPNKIKIEDFINSGNVEIDEENNSFTVTAQRESYVPDAVYKCFIKMALSIIPREELIYFEDTLKWIRNEEVNINFPLKAYRQFVPGVNPFQNIEMILAFRKETSKESVPYCVFCIGFTNYFYQVYVPYAQPDDFESSEKKFIFPIFPNKYSLHPKYINEIQFTPLDFSSNFKVKGEEIKLSYSFDKKIEINLSEIQSLEDL